MPRPCTSNQPVNVLRRACRLSAIETIETGSEWEFLTTLKGYHFKSFFLESVIEEIDRTRIQALRDVPALLRRVYVQLCQAWEDPGWKEDRAKSVRNVQALDRILDFLNAAEIAIPLIVCN